MNKETDLGAQWFEAWRLRQWAKGKTAEALGKKIEDIEEMMKYNVLTTPVLMIDDVIKIKGRVADINEIKQLLTA